MLQTKKEGQIMIMPSQQEYTEQAAECCMEQFSV